jgi:hypothetical protein
MARRTISRGRALKLAGAAVLAGTGLLSAFPRSAAAQTIEEGLDGVTTQASDPGCRGERSINNRVCPANACGGGRNNCFCAATTGGDKRCVSLRGERCPIVSECAGNDDCPARRFCTRVGGCCGAGINACLSACR